MKKESLVLHFTDIDGVVREVTPTTISVILERHGKWDILLNHQFIIDRYEKVKDAEENYNKLTDYINKHKNEKNIHIYKMTGLDENLANKHSLTFSVEHVF